MTLPDINEILVDKGLISKNTEYTNDVLAQAERYRLYEWHDVLAVAYEKKPLAVLQLSMPLDIDIDNVRSVLQLCEQNQVCAIQVKKSRWYMDTIFFHIDNVTQAIQLANILWNESYVMEGKLMCFSIGYLLGYDLENIRDYFSHNSIGVLSDKDITKFIADLKQYTPSLSDLGKDVVWHSAVTELKSSN